MYVPEDQYYQFENYLKGNYEKAFGGEATQQIEIRTQILHGTVQAAAEDLMEDLASEEAYEKLVHEANRFVRYFYADKDFLKYILDMENVDYSVSQHGINVAAISIGIAEELKLTEESPMTIKDLVVGCLIHDFEHEYNNLDRSLRRDHLNPSEGKIFQQHSYEAEKKISEHSFYSPIVTEVVGRHEEYIDGTGLRGIFEKDMGTHAQVAGVANAFDLYILYENLSPKDALKKLLIDKVGLLNLDMMKSLQKCLKRRNII